MNRLRIGIVGLGAHAQRSHIDPLASVDRAQIVAVCDPAPEARERQRSSGFAGSVYDSFEEILADETVDAVIICSPDRFHAEALAAAIDHGKHVLVEKPVADRREDLESVRNALTQAAERGLVVSSCHPRRFDPPFLWLRERLDDLRQQLGTALDVRFDFFYHQPSKRGLHHGLLIDHINHEIDLVHWMFGLSPFSAHKLYDDEIRYAASGTRDDGLCFTFFGSRDLTRKVYSEVMRVRFQRGEVEIDAEKGVATVRDWDLDSVRRFACGSTDYTARFLATNEDFVVAALNGAAPYLSATDLMINTEIGIALTEDGFFDSTESVAATA